MTTASESHTKLKTLPKNARDIDINESEFNNNQNFTQDTHNAVSIHNFGVLNQNKTKTSEMLNNMFILI